MVKCMLWLEFVVVGLLFWVVAATADPCPPAVKCITSDTSDSCRKRGLYLRNNVLFNGCCPGCVALAELNEPCNNNTDCAPGYKCTENNANKFICTEDPAQVCEAARRNAGQGAWQPICQADGSYSPRQCKGEPLSGRCFCFDSIGNRIFGEQNWHNAENMTCGCSRHVWNSLQKRRDVSLHCNDQGDFEELQCDDGVCWCANSQTGEPFTMKLPDTMMTTLPCYDTKKYGDQYLRQCDSLRIAQERISSLLSMHGTDNIFIVPVNCNYDGSYARVQIIDNRKKCVAKNKSPTSQWTSDLNDNTKNCNCEYDQFISPDPEQFNFQCLNNGNYAPMQYIGEKSFCVDSDGYNTPCL